MERPKLSLVVPCYTTKNNIATTLECIHSYSPDVFELIVVEDGGDVASNDLIAWTDKYLWRAKNEGFTKTVNEGWRLATGDYVAIANSDTRLQKGDLADLCIPGAVTSPLFQNDASAGYAHMAGAFFVVPRTVLWETGMLDEQFRQYYSDTDYAKRVDHRYRRVISVEVWHDKKMSTKDAPSSLFTNEQDERRFAHKWNL